MCTPNSIPTAATSPRFSKPKDDLRWLKMRLAPLRQVELILNRLLGVCSEDVDSSDEGELEWDGSRLSEVSLRSRLAWKSLVRTGRERPSSRFWDDLDDAQRILDACREDIVSMCTDPLVLNLLKEQGVMLLNEPGLFVMLTSCLMCDLF